MRAELIAAHRDTNYAVVDADLIQSFYQTLYEQEVSGETRYRLLRSTRVVAIAPGPAGLAATLRDDASSVRYAP